MLKKVNTYEDIVLVKRCVKKGFNFIDAVRRYTFAKLDTKMWETNVFKK